MEYLLSRSACKGFKKKSCRVSIFFGVFFSIILGYSALAVSLGYWYGSGQFGDSTSYSAPIVILENILLPFTITTNVMYRDYTLQFNVPLNTMHLDIYRAKCNSLPVVSEPFPELVFKWNFSYCPVQTCFFDEFVYQVPSNESIVIYNITTSNFAPEMTKIEILAFDSSQYICCNSSTTLASATPIKTVKMTNESLLFILNSSEIKKPSYYFFAIKLVGESSNEFTIKRTGTRAYYNTSSISPPILQCTTTSNSKNCSSKIQNDRFCYIGHVSNGRNKTRSQADIDQVTSIDYRVTDPSTTLYGYLIICITFFFILTIILITSFSCYKALRKKRQQLKGVIPIADYPDHSKIDSAIDSATCQYEDSKKVGKRVSASGDMPKLDMLDDSMHGNCNQADKLSPAVPDCDSSAHTNHSEADAKGLVISVNSTSVDRSSQHGYHKHRHGESIDDQKIPSTTSNIEKNDPHVILQKQSNSENTSDQPILMTEVDEDLGQQYSAIPFGQKGLFYHSDQYGVTIIIPEGAVETPASLQFGVSALWPNIECESAFEPVSPFVWVHTDAVLTKSVKLYIPHCIDIENSENTELVLLAKGHEENAVLKVQKGTKVEIFKTVGCVCMDHFCVVCLAHAMEGNPPKRQYHVLCAEKNISAGRRKEVNVCFLYALDCLENLRSFYKEKGYTIIAVHQLKGGISDEGITICTDLPTYGEWKVTEIGKKHKAIKISDIDIYEVLDCTSETVTEAAKKQLQIYEKMELYPPRFKLLFYTQVQHSGICHPVTISLKGLAADGEFSFNTLLGEHDVSSDALHRCPTTSSCSTLESTGPSRFQNSLDDADPFIALLPILEGALKDERKWFEFGHYLRIGIEKLQEIEITVGHDVRRCVRQILLQWRISFPGSSYKEISEALLKCGYPVLSAMITRRYSQSVSDHSLHNSESSDEYCIIEGPTVKEDLDKPHHPSTDSLGTETMRKVLASLPHGNEVLQSEPKLSDLNNLIVASLPAKWKLFGTQIGLDKSILDATDRDNHGRCRECFIEVIDTWKRTKSSPYTWETVLTVLYSPAVMEYKAGEDVYLHLMRVYSALTSTTIDT